MVRNRHGGVLLVRHVLRFSFHEITERINSICTVYLYFNSYCSAVLHSGGRSSGTLAERLFRKFRRGGIPGRAGWAVGGGRG